MQRWANAPVNHVLRILKRTLSSYPRVLLTAGERSRLHTKQCESSQACAKACGSGHICGPTANLLS